MSTAWKSSLLFAPLILAIGCGGGVKNELAMVPGTCLLHVHLEKGLSPMVLHEITALDESLVLAESLLVRGPVGITLMGVDITTLSPQFLFLSRNCSVDRAAGMAASMMNLTRRDRQGRADLVDRTGMIRASLAERGGWTALYLGPAADITMDAWLRMEEVGSLAADDALVQALPGKHHAVLMVPGNLFAFVSLIPLERYLTWGEDYFAAARLIRPAALVAAATWPSQGSVSLEVRVSREDGGMTGAVLTLSDTAISPDSAFTLLSGIAEELL
jgi:hypothetical protein